MVELWLKYPTLMLLSVFLGWAAIQFSTGVFTYFCLSWTPEKLAELERTHPSRAGLLRALKGATGDGAKFTRGLRQAWRGAVVVFVPEGAVKTLLLQLSEEDKI